MGCFEGIVFGMTGGLPRKQIEAIIKSNGALVSAIIHKRVDFVVCTPEAVKSNTQKVRKANKHGIPLVSQGFLTACTNTKRVVDHHAFLVSTGSSTTTNSKSPKVAIVRPVGQPASAVTDVKIVGDAHEVVDVKRDDVSKGRASVCTEEPLEGKKGSKRRRRRQMDAKQSQEGLGDGRLATATRKDGDGDEGLRPSRKKKLRLKKNGLLSREGRSGRAA